MSDPNPADVPTALAAVWAAHGRVDAEPKQGLSLRRVVEAAIAVADADGLAAVSMGRVAKHLGFTTMALYRHVRSKEELILFMQDAAIGPPVPGPAAGWRTGLEAWARALQARFRAHPWVVQTIPIVGAPVTPHQLAWLDQGLRYLGSTGFTEAEKLSTMLLVDAYVLGHLQFAPPGQPIVALGPEGYGHLLAEVLDPGRYPALIHAVQGGAFEDEPDSGSDSDDGLGILFDFGLARILDGVELLVDQRAAADRP